MNKELVNNVIEWGRERNLLSPENAPKQMLKVIEEIGELGGAIAKNNQADIKDAIGDSLVTIILLSAQLGYDTEDCLNEAYNVISKRTGKTVNGVFVKD
jgi:NTP pyrophosphatase (non-canonical NTP hydrolase)